jgi:transaldolase
MYYLIDTANIEEIKEYYPLTHGFTINPIHLENQGLTLETFINEINEIKKLRNKLMFIQVKDVDEVELVSSKLKGKYIVYKVILHPENISLIKYLIATDKTVCTTSVYDPLQINEAINLGCKYTMVYHHKNLNENLMEEAYKIKQLNNSFITLIGASFRTKEEVERALMSGMDYVTLRPETLKIIFDNKQLEEDFKQIEPEKQDNRNGIVSPEIIKRVIDESNIPSSVKKRLKE